MGTPPRDSTPPEGDRPEPVEPLALIVGQEARRVLSEAQLAPDPARTAQGWERRFITDAHRAHELLALYHELGYEACADPVRPEELGEGCDDCQLVLLQQFKTIYTRKRRGETR